MFRGADCTPDEAAPGRWGGCDGIASDCGGTALHTAAGHGIVRALNFLIEAGANVNAVDRNELTPLMNACSLGLVKGSQAALQLIEAGPDVRCILAGDAMTALKFAVQACTPEVLQALIDHGAEVDGPPGSKQTALMIAARTNNVESRKVLVRNGANLSLLCGLPWAAGKTAEGLAELEKRRATLKYLWSLRERSG